MRFGKLSFAASAILFMGIAAVFAGSALKLAYMWLGGIPLWDAANVLQSIGFVAVSTIFLLNVKTLMGQEVEQEPVPRYTPWCKPGMRFAELPKPEHDPESSDSRFGHTSPLGIALGKIDQRPKEVAHPPRTATVRKLNGHGLGGERLDKTDGVPGEYMAFTAHETRHEPERLDGVGERPTAAEHCHAG